MGRARPANRRQTPAPPAAVIAPAVAHPALPAAPQPESAPVAAGLEHSFARMSVLPAPSRAEVGIDPASPREHDRAIAPPAPSFWGRALPIQREGEANPGGTTQPALPPMPPELQLVDPSVIRPALSQINLMAPLTLPRPTVAPPAAAPQAGLPPVPNLTLTQPTIGPPAGGQSPPLFGPGSPPTLTPPGPSVPAGAGPALPRAASASDAFSAIIAVPVFDAAIKQLQINAQQKILTDWKGLNTGEKVGVVSALGVIALGALGGAMTDPESRKFVLGQISGKVLPVPGLPWLATEFTVGDDNLGFVLHLDMGQLLPPRWGFGKGSISPFGGPPVQRAIDAASPVDGRTTAEAIRSVSGGGQPLDGATRARLEPGLGADLGAVRVHDDARADGLARGVQARAFTSGQDIYFRQGTYAPASQAGMHLVAHEVAHTVQQAAGPVAGTPTAGGLSISDPIDSFERSAVEFADRVVTVAPGEAVDRGLSAQALAAPQIMRAPESGSPPPGPGTASPGQGTTVPPSTRSTISEAVEMIHDWLTPGPGATDVPAQRDRMLTEILLHQDEAAALKTAYCTAHNRELLDHIQERYGSDYALRADEYLNWGRLRGVAKLLLAIDGLGTKEETVWRVLPEVHGEGEPTEKWKNLVARPLEITQKWSAYTLDAALADDFSGGELDKARALVRFGKLRDIDKISVGIKSLNTDEALILEGLREANRSTVRAEFKAYYAADLDELLFGKVAPDGEMISSGVLSGEDSAHAKMLLETRSNDPDRLVKIVEVATRGLGTNTELIWKEVGDAIKKRSSKDPEESKAAEEELLRLKKKVDHSKDELGLKGYFGDLSDADHARLRAMLGITETEEGIPSGSGHTLEMINNALVQKLRALGGVDSDTAYDALMKADPATTTEFGNAWKDKESPFHKYLSLNITVNSGQYTGLETIFNPSFYARLRFCAGGLRDDYEDYAYNLLQNHSSPAQRLELRKAQNLTDQGQQPGGEAGGVILALKEAFSTAEMDKVRSILQYDQIDIRDRAEELKGNIAREGTDEATDDERRQMVADINQASRDGNISPGEEARIRGTQDKVASALQGHIQLRDEYTNYASQAVSFAIGALVSVASGGAATPLVMAAIVRAAVATAMARVLTEKALRGDKFDLAGADGVRAFINGAVDGAMNVAGGAIAARAMGAVAGKAVQEAIEQGTATIGTKLAASAIEGGASGAASGTVDAVTNEDTWRGSVRDGLTIVFNSGIAAAAQGAVVSVGFASLHALAAHPAPDAALVTAAIKDDDAAIRKLMPQLGERWEVIIADLTNGTGRSAGLAPSERLDLRKALVDHRKRLLGTLDERFGARPAKGASTEAGSDVDLNVMGEAAGQKLLDARAFLDKEYGLDWPQQYRMALLIDADRVGTIYKHLSSVELAQVEAHIARTGELYTLARQIRGTEPQGRAALLDKVSGEDRVRVSQMVDMDDAARRTAHDTALLEGDAAAQRLSKATDPKEKVALAIEVTERQMYANMLNEDAYITPGAVSHFAAGRPIRSAADRYGAVLEQVGMIDHQVHANHGVLAAMRSYEIFKYIQRFCDLVEGSKLAIGDDAASLEFFRNWAEYIYKVEREATASATAGGPRNLASSADTARVRLRQPDAPKAGVSDKFLLDNYREFQPFADRMSGRLRQAGLGENAPPVGGAPPAGGEPAALITVPKLTPADEAALTTPAAAHAPDAPGVTAAAGVTSGAVTPVLNRVNAPIGRPTADVDSARALVIRLTAGDATALHEIGITPPPNYDPRGREWGIGRTAGGNIVIIEGMAGGVSWAEFTKAGGMPLSHSHPMVPGREMKTPGKTMAELIPGTGREDLDAIHVLPSVEDFLFCVDNKLDRHDVFTPYAHLGDGKIGNPAEGLPLINFRIVGIEHVGDMDGLPVYRAMLGVGDSSGGTFDVAPVWVLGTPHVNEISPSPPNGMVARAP